MEGIKTLVIKSGYFSSVHNERVLLYNAQNALSKVSFDTMVGVGMSGILAVSQLAPAMGKLALYLRKPNDGSHTRQLAEGMIGRRWIFIDDLIETGETFAMSYERVKKILKGHGYDSTFAGLYLYEDGGYRAPDDPYVLSLLKEWEIKGTRA